MNEQEKKEHFDRLASQLDRWKAKNRYYHEQIKRFYSLVIPEGQRILEIGCSTGDLLFSLKPGYGVGIDISEKMIQIAKNKYPDLNFFSCGIEALNSEEKFDYIVLSNLIEYVDDCCDFIGKLKKFISADTKVIITNVNPLWEPLMNLGARLRLKTPDVPRNYITKKDIINMLALCDYDIIEDGFRLIFPMKIFFVSDFINKLFCRIPGLNNLCCMQYIIFRNKIRNPQGQGFSCSVLVPCFNEAQNLEKCVQRIPRMGKFTQIIIIDDGSTDSTGRIAEKIAQENPAVLAVSHPQNRGKAQAIKTGFEHSTGDIVIILDADMTVPPEELPYFFLAIAEGKAEFVNGTRMIYPMEKGAMRFINFLGNKIFGIILSLMTGQRNTDTLCGTKAILRKYFKYLNFNSTWGDFDLLFGAAKLKLKTEEIPVHYKKRTAGYSKMRAIKEGFSLLKVCRVWFSELA